MSQPIHDDDGAQLEPHDVVASTDTLAAAPVEAEPSGIYARWAPRYREAGFDPVPVTPGQKACHIPGWTHSMHADAFAESLARYPDYGIGLVMGSRLPDGTTLAALDVDDDKYVRTATALLGKPCCVRRGARGVGIFVRLRGPLDYQAYKVRADEKGSAKKHSELLTCRRLLVIPPTIHPTTGQPYRWLGPSLLDINIDDLPIIEADA